jgi:hypothetical protein
MLRRSFRYTVLGLSLLLLGPLYMFALGSEAANPSRNDGWRFASRESANFSPLPATHPDAVIQVFAARAWSWRGHLAVHTWVATKEQGAERYLTHQVIGFRSSRGLTVVQSQPDLPDRHWYGNAPELLVDIRGAAAQELIPRILAAVDSYRYPELYTLWPGPNSNTFVAHVGRQVPELGLVLPVTAIGKDYLPGGALLAATPSGTGYQLSVLGALGLMGGIDEGIEVNLLGLAFGIDFLRPALKLPGIGRIGMRRVVQLP